MATHLLAEHRGPAATRPGHRLARLSVDDADGVETFDLVLLRGQVAETLVGDRVHDDGAVESLGTGQRVLHRSDVVAVDGSDVLQPQILEHALRRNDVLEALLHPVQGLVERCADDRRATEQPLAPVEEALVSTGRAQGREVGGQTADRRRVGPLVVVDDDDDRTFGGRDVVERLPGHAAGEGAVADDGDDVALTELPGELEALGDAVDPRQRGRRVAVLDDVVLGLRPAGVARQPTSWRSVSKPRAAR